MDYISLTLFSKATAEKWEVLKKRVGHRQQRSATFLSLSWSFGNMSKEGPF